MKKIAAFVLVIVGISLAAFKAQNQEKFSVDIKRSSIKWLAGKVAGSHEGTIRLSSGTLFLNGNSLAGGSFVMNMQSITINDLKGESRQNLLNHLKSDDFFSVAENPTSTFQITKVTPSGAGQVMITGNLTIKGITNPLSFAASFKRQGNTVTAVAKGIKVDRTKYNIRYRSKSFFGDIGDKAIDDEFELDVNLVGRL